MIHLDNISKQIGHQIVTSKPPGTIEWE